MFRRIPVFFAVGALLFSFSGRAAAQESGSPATHPSGVATDEAFAPTEAPPSELKIHLAPLGMEGLEAVRDQIMEALTAHAVRLADLLVRRHRLEQAADRDPEAIAAIDEQLVELIAVKAEQVSRANVVLDAIEARGGDVAATRAQVAAINSLQVENSLDAGEQEATSPEERKAAAIRGRVAELVAVVRSEPPIHERAHPWDVPVSELELELQPLTLAQVEERLQAWQEILAREVRKRVRYDILLNNPDKLAAAQTIRDELARASGAKSDAVEEMHLDALKSELATLSQAQQQIVRSIVERMNAAIRLVQLRGGDPKEHVDYIASATGQRLNLYDPAVLYAQVKAWLFSRNGGVDIGLRILKFIGVLAAFWVLSLILGKLANAGVNRMPRTSSLLRPLLVTGVKRVTMVVGLIIAITMLGVNTGPLLAIIGATGLVVGLALQGTLSNFASGIMILVNRPFDVGDAISAGGVVGKVEAMNLVSTSILTFDNQVMLVPNNEIWNGVITNITGRDTRRVDMTFGISYSDDVAKAVAVLEEMLGAHPKVLSDPSPVVRVSELADNSVNLIARPWTKTSDYWDVYWDMMRDVKLRFDREGINIPFPQRDIHLPGPIEVTWSGFPGGDGNQPAAGRSPRAKDQPVRSGT